jgi:mersacidin/lichenicidin family type 2 lantibiotic
MKKNIDVARAWRDEEYYLSLTEEERNSLGAHPAGASSLDDGILKSITGGCGCTVDPCTTNYTCNGTIICTPCKGYDCA